MNALKNNSEAGVRRIAAGALEKFPNPDVIAALKNALISDKGISIPFLTGPSGYIPTIKISIDEQYGVCIKAANSLKKMGTPEAIKALIDAFKAIKNEWLLEKLRAILATILGTTKDEKKLFDFASFFVEDQKKEGKKSGIGKVQGLEEPSCFDFLCLLLEENKRDFVRKGAAQALGNMGNKEAIEPLSAALMKDKKKNVRISAAQALGNMGDKEAIEPLSAALMEDKKKHVRISSAQALGKIACVDGIILNANVKLRLVTALLMDRSEAVCKAVVDPLIKCADDGVLSILLCSLFEEKADNRLRNVLEILMPLKAKEAVTLFLHCHKKLLGASLAKEKKKKRENPRAIKPLLELLAKDKRDNVRAFAAQRLGDMGDIKEAALKKKIHLALISASFIDPSKKVKNAAVEALIKRKYEKGIAILLQHLNKKEDKERQRFTCFLKVLMLFKFNEVLKNALMGDRDKKYCLSLTKSLDKVEKKSLNQFLGEDKEKNIGLSAIKAKKNPRAIKPLLALLAKDKGEKVCRCAVKALEKMVD